MIKDKSSQFLLAGKQRDDYFSTELSKAVGTSFRRNHPQTLSGRAIVDAASLSSNDDPFCGRLEAEELLSLGLAPVRGMLLYGPPGT